MLNGFYANDEKRGAESAKILQSAITIGEGAAQKPLIFAKVTDTDVFYTESATR